jgi:hypothetical protein
MYEILGSKKKMRTYYGLLDFLKDSTYMADINIFLTSNKITLDHLRLIPSLKENGNISAHADRPILLRSDWDELAIKSLDDPTDEEDKQMVRELLILSEKYNKPDINGLWNIKKP